MRRFILAAVAGLFLCQHLVSPRAELADTDQPPRVISLDWGLTSTLLALGAAVPAIAEKKSYADWVGDGQAPATAVDLGLRLAPDMERLRELQPDLILITPQFSSIEPRLNLVAKTRSFATFTPDRTPLANATEITRQLGQMLHLDHNAVQLIAQSTAALDALRETATPAQKACEFLMVNFVDDTHVRVFGNGSLYGDVLKAAGIRNAWTRPTNFWGYGTASLNALLRQPEAGLLIVGPVPLDVQRQLQPDRSLGASDTLLDRLPAVQAGRYRVLPAIWSFGGLPEATALAKALMAADLPECDHEKS
ncbi:ABC transporter substrate-binding protein [Roseibium algae]|uniref:ABC transporter substrate-binding protein n=1 Tax=Roseibium algae TaxID=3123038 RepID=A0ABU8TKP9_9HYPH